jgi:hypothetical protein
LDALTIGRSDVLRSADVTQARERQRQRRLARLAMALGVVLLPLAVRAFVGASRYARGDLKGAACGRCLTFPPAPPLTSPDSS